MAAAARSAAGGGTQDLSALAAAITSQFPGWRAWTSDARRWWATRTTTLPAQPPPGYAMTVDADTAAGLAEEILRQEAVPPG